MGKDYFVPETRSNAVFRGAVAVQGSEAQNPPTSCALARDIQHRNHIIIIIIISTFLILTPTLTTYTHEGKHCQSAISLAFRFSFCINLKKDSFSLLQCFSVLKRTDPLPDDVRYSAADRFEARSCWHCVALLQLLLQWRRALPAPNMAAALTSAPFNSSLERGEGKGGVGEKAKTEIGICTRYMDNKTREWMNE